MKFSRNNLRITTKDYLILCDNLRTYLTRSSTQKIIKTFPARTKSFESSFFPYCAEAWGNLIEELRNINSINTFKSSILNFVRPTENSVFEVHDIKGVRFKTRLRLDFGHLMNINFNIALMIQSILCVPAVKNPKQLSTTFVVRPLFNLLTRTP